MTSKKTRKQKNKKTKKHEDMKVREGEHEFVRVPLEEVESVDAEPGNQEESKEVETKEKSSAVVSGIDESKIDEQITEIYENEDGSMPDMKKFQKKPGRGLIRALLVLLASVAVLAFVAWVGFFVLSNSSRFNQADVILTISGDEVVEVGEGARYRIRYRNAQDSILTNSLIQVRYPEGFVFEESSQPPSGERSDTWILPDLNSNDSGYIDIFGKMYGTVGESQSFRVFFNYTPKNFSSEFQKVETAMVKIESVPVDMIVEGPEEAVQASDGAFRVVLDNLAETGLSNFAVELMSKEFFNVKESSLKPDQFFDNRWSFEELADEATLDLIGSFASDLADDSGELTFRLVGWKDDSREAEPYVYKEVKHEIKFLETDLSANLVINGTAKSLSVQPGEVLNASIILRNAGDKPQKNVVARLVIDAPSSDRQSLLKWTDLQDENDGDVFGEQLNNDRRRGIITWDKSHILDFRQLDPDEEQIIDISLPLKNSTDTDLTDFPNGTIEATLEIEYELDNGKEVYSGSPIVMMVNSDTDFEVRHSGDTESGLGEHEYTWVVNNTFHELESLMAEVDLYGKVDFTTGSVSVPAGELEYNEEVQKLTWRIDKMPIGLDVLALQFLVNVEEVNAGQTNLTSKVRFEAKDTITGEVIRKVGNEILLGESEEE